MRPVLLLSLLLACCSNAQNPAFSSRPPGLDVADVALASGAPDTALHIAQQALAANPRDVHALVRAGQAQAALGQRELAVHSFTQALDIAPDDNDAAMALGRLELATDPAAAAAVLLRLVARDPRDVAALIDLGIARDLLGQQAEAQRAYRLALAIDPDRVAAKVNLGLSLALSGDPQQALTLLRPLAASASTSPRIRQDLAVALVLAGDSQEAEQLLHSEVSQPEVLAALTGYRALLPRP